LVGDINRVVGDDDSERVVELRPGPDAQSGEDAAVAGEWVHFNQGAVGAGAVEAVVGDEDVAVVGESGPERPEERYALAADARLRDDRTVAGHRVDAADPARTFLIVNLIDDDEVAVPEWHVA